MSATNQARWTVGQLGVTELGVALAAGILVYAKKMTICYWLGLFVYSAFWGRR